METSQFAIDLTTGFIQQDLFPIEKKLEILKLLEIKPMLLTAACTVAHVPRREFDKAKEFDKVFADKLEEIRVRHTEEVEQMLLANAKEWKGVSDRQMYLKTHKPEIYADKRTLEITGNTALLDLVKKAKEYKEQQIVIEAQIVHTDQA